MKKFALTVIAAVLTLAATIPVANAAVGTGTFNVNATLTSACTVGAFSGAVNFGTVIAFTAATAPAVTVPISCTRNLTGVTAVFDSSAVTSTGTAGTSPTAAGLLDNGLYYTITSNLAAATPGAAASVTAAGGADIRVFTINGAIAPQAGTCITGTCIATTQVRTLTLNY